MSDLSKHRRAKEFLRHVAIELCGRLLEASSRPCELKDGPVVIIAPHQDDESLACGGLIARRRNEGLPVHVVFITDGSASHPNHARLGPADVARLRRTEAMRAMACLGVERTAVLFLDEPDGTLKSITAPRREQLVARLTACFTAIGPVEVFLPCHPDGSSEHDASFGFVVDALARSGLRPDLWQYPVWSWWNPTLLVRRWLATRDCRRLPLEDFRPHKKKAIQCYQTQIAPLAPDVTAALPAELVDIVQTDAEYFFRYELPPAS